MEVQPNHVLKLIDQILLNPYSVSKLAGENLMKMYNDLYGIQTVSLRYFNVYGPRQAHKGQYAPVIGIFQNKI